MKTERPLTELSAWGPETPVNMVIDEQSLPLYQQTAEQTGFSVKVTAQEGEQHSFWGHDERVRRTTTIQPGFVAISISAPEGQIDHEPLYDAMNRLKQASSQE